MGRDSLGTSILYVTSAEADVRGNADIESIAEAMCIENIVDASSRERQEGGCIQYKFGTHSKRLFNSSFAMPGGELVCTVLEDFVTGFEDLRLFSLANPVPIPIMTHEYPVFCPECRDPIDDTFQAQLSQVTPDFFAGVVETHRFCCDSCNAEFPLAALLEQGEILHRHCFLEIYNISCVSRHTSLLSEPVHEALQAVFGPLALRHGWLT